MTFSIHSKTLQHIPFCVTYRFFWGRNIYCFIGHRFRTNAELGSLRLGKEHPDTQQTERKLQEIARIQKQFPTCIAAEISEAVAPLALVGFQEKNAVLYTLARYLLDIRFVDRIETAQL